VAKIRPRVAQGGQGGQDETRMVKGGQMRPRMAKDTNKQQGGFHALSPSGMAKNVLYNQRVAQLPSAAT